MAAGVAAMAMVLSGCGAGDDGGVVPTERVAQGPVNPWDLPLQERPPLFDPCAEIPIELIEAGIGEPVTPVEELRNHRENELYSCGWTTDELMVGLLATWKTRADYIEDPMYSLQEGLEVSGRSGTRMVGSSGNPDRDCYTILFTERGTAWLNITLVTGLREFRGELFSNACDALDEVGDEIIAKFPEGSF